MAKQSPTIYDARPVSCAFRPPVVRFESLFSLRLASWVLLSEKLAGSGERRAGPLSHRRPYDPSASSRVADPEEVSAAGGDIERALIEIAKSAVGRCVYANRHRVSLQPAPLGVPDVDHRARTAGVGACGGDSISLGVEAHAIDAPLRASVIFAELMQNDKAA